MTSGSLESAEGESSPHRGGPILLQRELDSLKVTDDWAVQAVELLFNAAFAAGCSDVHIACLRQEVVIRGRKDGQFFPFAKVRTDVKDLLLGRLKVLAQLPAFVRNEPQDGRIRWTFPNGSAEVLRCSFLPTLHGENAVVRFPESSERANLELDSLGMTLPVSRAVKGLLARREGVIAVTGPGSSGKSTTMYAMLRFLNSRHGDRLNILTIEDPPERELDFAGQVAVNAAQGLTFDKILRAALRQDPNVIMVGEARDAETARIAIQAGMTGHLVITTVHAGRASRVFSRLLSMGVEPHLVASAMSGAIAQRLARKLCVACRGSGCHLCGNIGCDGRIGVYEAIIADDGLQELMLARATSEEIARLASQSQIGSIQDDARKLAEEGIISVSEYEFLFADEGRP